MADPEVQHEEADTEDADNCERSANCSTTVGEAGAVGENSSSCWTNSGADIIFDDLSGFVLASDEKSFDKLFASRYTMECTSYAEVTKGFPDPIVLHPWTSRPKRNFDYLKRRGESYSGEPRDKRQRNDANGGERGGWRGDRERGGWRGDRERGGWRGGGYDGREQWQRRRDHAGQGERTGCYMDGNGAIEEGRMTRKKRNPDMDRDREVYPGRRDD